MSAGRPLIYITVGEPSGDQLGAHLVDGLRELSGGEVDFTGLAGDRMAAKGLTSLFPPNELAVMGLDLLPHLRRLLRRVHETVEDIVARRPAALVTIDAQGFSAQVGRRVRARLDIPIIQYVGPTVWAYKPGRAKKRAQYLDRILSIFPFEPPYFEAHGLETTFVGHPAAEAGRRPMDGPGFRRELGVPPAATVLCVLPGSRHGEIHRNLPVIAEVVRRIRDAKPDLHCLLPTVPAVADLVARETRGWSAPVSIIRNSADKYRAFAASDAALATSGTVTVETSFAGLPTVVVYRGSAVAARLVKTFNLIKVPYASGANLVLDRPALPEFIQWYAKPEAVTAAVLRLLDDEDARRRIKADMQEAAALLSCGDEQPSRIAARAILDEISAYPRGRRAARATSDTNG